jgi:ubiquinone/menaquinone biosynthesis C-methylase UbiE
LFQYRTGKAGAEALGYDKDILERFSEDVLSSFCGVGNPLSLGEVARHSDILDVGCGAGFDLIVAAAKAGLGGKIRGVDLSPEMVKRARAGFENLGLDGIETYVVGSENLPFEDDGFDLVISNGVINLSPAKAQLFAEIHRVLKPGGRVRIADIVLDRELPSQVAGGLESWAQ